MHEQNSFVTLTYDDEHLPENGGLDVSHWQLFAKRLRKALGPFRFLHCGEYGETSGRPHYHALLFGLDFSRDRQETRRTRKYVSWRSPTLESIWGLGLCDIGSVTIESASYVARYAMKKAGGEPARIDVSTGEVLRPSYITMSRRPGLGATWIEKYHSDVYPSDEVVHAGVSYRPPRFYDDRLPEPDLAELKARRARRAAERKGENHYTRLRVRESVAASRLSQLRRDCV